MDERLSVGPYVVEGADFAAALWAVKWNFVDHLYTVYALGCRSLGIALVGYLTADSLLAQFTQLREFENSDLLPLACGGLVALFDLAAVGPYFNRRSFRKQNLPGRKQSVTISSTLIEAAEGEIGSTLPWHEVHYVAQTGKHTFLFLTPLTALMIPARAFPSGQAARLFGQKAHDWHAAAKKARESN